MSNDFFRLVLFLKLFKIMVVSVLSDVVMILSGMEEVMMFFYRNGRSVSSFMTVSSK